MKCHFIRIKIHLFNTSSTQSPKVNAIEDTKKYKISVLRDLTILLESHTNRKKIKIYLVKLDCVLNQKYKTIRIISNTYYCKLEYSRKAFSEKAKL